jgi:signal transduction histidine kinase
MMRSARSRIVGWMLLLVAVALLCSVVVASRALSARADDLAHDELLHEADKFRSFGASEVASQYGTVDALLSRYLIDNLPDSYEAFFSVVDGQADARSRDVPNGRLDSQAAFVTQVATTSTAVTGWADSPAGRVRYISIPVTVQGDDRAGRLVVLEYRDVIAAPLTSAVRVFAGAAAVALPCAGGLGWFIAGRVLAPIRTVTDAAASISESDLRQRIPVRGRDDVAALAVTFNRMLDRLDTAFVGQRQFLDDAGHELRTPLTILRSHLELLDDDPASREANKSLVLDEIARMSRIIDDLLLLAKAERPDFITLGTVELADVTAEAMAKAQLLADRRWRLDALADVSISADRQRLTQALLQLAANAVTHTQPGDRITFGSELVPDAFGPRVQLWVADTGPGVPPEARDSIFDRFARGTATQHRDGAGLGLAIVRSIARAHGGDVRLADRGPGACFVLDLPALNARLNDSDLPDSDLPDSDVAAGGSEPPTGPPAVNPAPPASVATGLPTSVRNGPRP